MRHGNRLPGSSAGWSSSICAGGGGEEGEWNADYDEEKRNMASSGFLCILDKKNAITYKNNNPKYSGFHSYFIQKRSIYERFEEFVYPEEINLKAQQNVQN